MNNPETVITTKNNNHPAISRKNNSRSMILFAGLNILLALAMNQFAVISTLHAVLTLIVGLLISITTREPRKIAWGAAYIVGAEILWRMTGASVFWEYGKYAIIAVMLLGLLRTHRIHSAGLPVLYFALFCISIPMTFWDLPFNEARQAVSFNLSGPLSLAVAALFFSQIKLNWEDREKLIWYLVSPILGIAAICVWGIITSEKLAFTDESNFATSGGFGPNQVSAVLGLGALLLILLAIQQSHGGKRWVPFFLALGFLTLSVLTFSRGGLYNFVAALLAFGVFSLRSSRTRNSLAFILLVGVFIGGFVVYPQLNKFTDGMLQTRFSNTETTGRTEIALTEIQIWRDHPILGVGPGMGAYASIESMGIKVAAHTEYTRILVEHGIPGLLAILIMMIMAVKSFLKAPKGLAQAWTSALIVWPMAEMTHAAMRIAAIGFIFGLAMAQWYSTERTPSNGSSVQVTSHR